MSSPTTVAVIGTGAMGAPMARRLMETGFHVVACDRDESVLLELLDEGASVTKEPRLCAEADVVLVLVATAEQARAVVAEDGLLAGVDPARPPVVVLMGTMAADAATSIHDELNALGVAVLDAPISGGVVRARSGDLSVIVGGDAIDLATVRPVLDALASNVYHCGPIGSGSTMKIINNIVGTASSMVLAEAGRIAVEKGLDIEMVSAVFDGSSGRTFLTGTEGEVAEFFRTLTRTRETFASLTAIMRKDLGLAADMAASVEGSYPVVTHLKNFADSIGDETYDNWHAVGGQPPRPEGS